VKRFGIAVLTGVTSVVLLAGPVLAQEYPPSKQPLNPVNPGAGTDPGQSVAFTGANITLGMVIVAALVVVGLALLFASRRRPVEVSG
jgi:hypothetical protein